MPHVPVGVVIEPVIKQASLHGYNNLDFDFFIALSKHPRLTVRHGLMTIDLLGKSALMTLFWSSWNSSLPHTCEEVW